MVAKTKRRIVDDEQGTLFNDKPVPKTKKRLGVQEEAEVVPVEITPELATALEDCLVRLPNKFTELRPHQVQAIVEILNAYMDGYDLVILDAPTGSGKTLIAEVVRMVLDIKSTYICSDKGLQAQFVTDFPYAHLLQGRGNYPTLDGPPYVTANDCDKEGGVPLDADSCSYCSLCEDCPYEVAKQRAIKGQLAVLNTAYFLAECNYVGSMRNRPFGIVDECDTLESQLMGFVEFKVGEDRMRELGLRAPKKGVHKATLKAWILEDLIPAIANAVSSMAGLESDLNAKRRLKALNYMARDAKFVAAELDDNWVRDYEWKPNGAEPNSVILKPVRIDRYGRRNLWNWSKKWLIMSATVVSDEEMIDSLGMNQPTYNIETGEVVSHSLKVKLVRVPMTFPAENRPVIFSGLANMSRKGEIEDTPKLLDGIVRLCKAYPSRTLIHAHKYALADLIVKELHERCPDRVVITYKKSAEKDEALRRLADNKDAILVAVSMGRGVDLPNDLCRLQIIAKVPFPFLGDKQVSERMRGKGGEAWYATQTARVILQACGRGVRHKEDWCATWILDKNFGRFYRDNKGLFPDWWRDAYEIVPSRGFERRVEI